MVTRTERGRTTIALRPAGPFDADHMLAFLGARAVPGVEALSGHTYARSLALPGGAATVALTFRPRRVGVELAVADPRDADEAMRRVRHLLDLDADMAPVRRALGPLCAARAGVRSVGAVDAEEVAVRAVVGQQVSVAAARTVLGRIAEQAGQVLPPDLALPGVTRLFPRAGALDPASLPLPAARARAVAALDGADLGRLTDIPGIGPWTAAYVAMRTGNRDVLLDTDLVVRRELERLAADPERWRPFRSYATHHLWLRASRRGIA